MKWIKTIDQWDAYRGPYRFTIRRIGNIWPQVAYVVSVSTRMGQFIVSWESWGGITLARKSAEKWLEQHKGEKP